MSRHGINRLDNGFLVRASFEETVEILLDAAAFNESNPTHGVTESIILGQGTKIGTGMCDVIIDAKYKRKWLPDEEYVPVEKKRKITRTNTTDTTLRWKRRRRRRTTPWISHASTIWRYPLPPTNRYEREIMGKVRVPEWICRTYGYIWKHGYGNTWRYGHIWGMGTEMHGGMDTYGGMGMGMYGGMNTYEGMGMEMHGGMDAYRGMVMYGGMIRTQKREATNRSLYLGIDRPLPPYPIVPPPSAVKPVVLNSVLLQSLLDIIQSKRNG